VYRNWKEQERQNAELREQLESQLIGAPETQQYYDEDRAAVSPQGDDDPWGELRNVIGETVEQRMAPLRQMFESQQQAAQVQQNYARFQQANPEFKVEVHGPRTKQVIDAYKARGVQMPLDAAYTIAFPDLAASKFAPPPPATQQAPVANVGGVSSAPPAESPDALWQAMTQESNPARREELYQRYISTGAGGVRGAEAKLGW
jgi:hypothetical protein